MDMISAVPGMTAERMKTSELEAEWNGDWLSGDFSVVGADFSPSMPTDGFPGTVSPSDIWNSSPGTFASPCSTFFDSPLEGYQTSPLVNTDDVFPPESEQWPSLFPETTADHAHTQSHLPIHESVSAKLSSPVEAHSPDATRHMRSSSVASGKRSSTCGVRKRSSPLPEPQYDPNDKAAVKRVKNTLAARKSRQKKADRISFLESRVEELEPEVLRLGSRVEELEPEVHRLKSQVEELQAEVEKWKALALSK